MKCATRFEKTVRRLQNSWDADKPSGLSGTNRHRRLALRRNKSGIAMIETTPDEAFLLFEKWWSEKAVVTCFSSFFDWSFTFRGRLSAISRDEVSLVSLDAAVTLTVPLRKEGLRIGNAESEEASLTEGVPKGLPGLV